jgi:hypothetical protein
MESFGDRSYFYYLDRQTLYNIPMPEISDDEYNEEDRLQDNELEFAEQGEL